MKASLIETNAQGLASHLDHLGVETLAHLSPCKQHQSVLILLILLRKL